MLHRWIASCSLVAVTAACSVEVEEPLRLGDFDPEIGQAAAPLQLGYTPGVVLADDNINSSIRFSSAAIRGRNVSATQPFGSCGMTWVSPHYGVTAAHCVKNMVVRERSLIVEDIRVGQVNINELIGYMSVVGSWATGFEPGGQVSTGYSVNRYTNCYVSRRCDPSNGGRHSCPIADNADIALIKCPSRDHTDYALTTSSLAGPNVPLATAVRVDDDFALGMNTWWFHEVYDLPTEDDGSDRWHHYGKYEGPSTALENWHYTREHQLLPLLSFRFPNGTLYRNVASNHATLNTMDTPICHGTSGSGVFIHGMNVLLGPAISAGSQSQIRDRLCEPADRAVSGAALTNYIRGAITDAFVRSSPEVASDR